MSMIPAFHVASGISNRTRRTRCRVGVCPLDGAPAGSVRWVSGLTWLTLVKHPYPVRLLNRLSALLLAFALIGGNAAVCAGWAATPQERMACCAEGGNCPMHKHESHDSSRRTLSQVEADTCCALSDRENSNPSTPTFVSAISVAVLGAGILLPATVPPLVLSDGWRTDSPIPVTTVPKHILLSAFLL